MASVGLRDFLATRHELQVRCMEAGGGGDCLYHSFAAALGKMLQGNSAAMQHVLRNFPAQGDLPLFSSRSAIVRRLRAMAAMRFEDWPPEQFLDLLIQKATSKKWGTFPDKWDPVQDWEDHGFGCLTRDNVESVG